MFTSRKTLMELTLGTLVMAAWPVMGQETCAEYPDLDSCSTTPVGVCDAAAAAPFVIDEGNNHWVVLPADDDPLYPGQCSYEDDSDPFNERRVTTKDDTNNLQCALDFASAGRTEEGDAATITLKSGRYCVRNPLVAMDFSGTIHGTGKGMTTVDFDNPALVDENGQLTGEGGYRTIYNVSKSVVDPSGEPIPLLDRVEVAGDEPGTTFAARFFRTSTGGLVFANNRFNARKVVIRDLHFNAGKGTRNYAQTIHGFSNVIARPLSISSFVSDTTVYGGETLSFGGRSDELSFNGCAHRAGQVFNYNGGQPWYERDTGIDLTAVDPELCVLPLNDTAEMESPVYPRNCGPDACAPYAYDLQTMPSITTRLIDIKATGRGNTNNGLYYLNSERNQTIDQVVSGDEVLSLVQPVRFNFTLKDSLLRGLSSEFVGSMFDFGVTPMVNGRASINNNVMSRFREDGEVYGCGRLWERLVLSRTAFFFRDNTVRGCQGAIVRHAGEQFFNARGIDGASNTANASALPFPGRSKIFLLRNDYRQGPVVAGVEDGVASFFSAVDWLNNGFIEDVVGIPFPSLAVTVKDNKIATAEYRPVQISPFLSVPVALVASNDARVINNEISGTNAAAIAVGLFPEDYRHYDRNARVINNDVSDFAVIPCLFPPGISTPCNTETALSAEAANAAVWLGPGVSGSRVIVPDDAPYLVGDLGSDNRITN